jgi:Rrf2 family transcriptional regulator, nitric oxide-sensitive transcriptional repressor
MMISTTAEYALRAVVQLAMHEGVPQTTEAIAKMTRVPSSYLSKVLQQLARAGIVSSQRGLGGGFVLTRAPVDISVLDVIDAVDPIKRIRTCPLGIASHGVNLCRMHKRLDEAIESVEKAFRESTIAELLANPTESIPFIPTKR